MKKVFALVCICALLLGLTGCGGVDGLRFVRTKQSNNLTMYYRMEFSEDIVYYSGSYYDSHKNESGNGPSERGTYTIDGDMVYVTWEDGEHDAFIYNEAAGSLSHTVEDWMVYYKE